MLTSFVLLVNAKTNDVVFFSQESLTKLDLSVVLGILCNVSFFHYAPDGLSINHCFLVPDDTF